MHWGCYYATALDIEVDPQRCCLGSRQSDFALQAVVECRALEPERGLSEHFFLFCFAITWYTPCVPRSDGDLRSDSGEVVCVSSSLFYVIDTGSTGSRRAGQPPRDVVYGESPRRLWEGPRRLWEGPRRLCQGQGPRSCVCLLLQDLLQSCSRGGRSSHTAYLSRRRLIHHVFQSPAARTPRI